MALFILPAKSKKLDFEPQCVSGRPEQQKEMATPVDLEPG